MLHRMIRPLMDSAYVRHARLFGKTEQVHVRIAQPLALIVDGRKVPFRFLHVGVSDANLRDRILIKELD